MKWPEASKLIEKIRRERPELTVEIHGDSAKGHHHLRLYCMKKVPGSNDPGASRHLIRESLDTIHGTEGWKRYKTRHPEPWCRPEESYHTDALGREIDHHGVPVKASPPPSAPQVSAAEMLERICALNKSDPDWWLKPERLLEMAASWGVRVQRHGLIADCEPVEVVRLSGDCHATIYVAVTGSGLYASGYAARWGDGSVSMPPSILSVPFDSEYEARRAAFTNLLADLDSGRGAARHQQRQLLLAAVKQQDLERGLFL